MRRVQTWNMTTVAGAGTYAANMTSENGVVRTAATWRVPKSMALMKVKAMGANGLRFTITRSAHVADTLVFPQLADTLADREKEIDLEKLLDGAGIEFIEGEDVTITVTVGGNASVNLFLEFDESKQRVNVRAPRVAGAAAAVADTPTETGANLRAALGSANKYVLKALLVTSTTIQGAITRFTPTGQESFESIDTPGALVAGAGNYAKLDKPVSGTGAVFGTDFYLDVVCSAADAANVQDIYGLFETN